MKTMKKLFWWCLWSGVAFGVAGIALPVYDVISWKNGVGIEMFSLLLELVAVASGSEYNRRKQIEIWNSKYDWVQRID